jgi:hypothetical protein
MDKLLEKINQSVLAEQLVCQLATLLAAAMRRDWEQRNA